MLRVPEIGDADLSAGVESLFASDRELFGEVLSASRVYAYQPEVFVEVQRLHGALESHSALPARLVRLARLRVAEIHDSPF